MAHEIFSIVIPAKDESDGLRRILPELRGHYPNAEIIVVDDGSTDDTRDVAEQFASRIVSHPYPMGNGAAIKSGARSASKDLIVFMDADGQHSPQDISRLLSEQDDKFDMVVGARKLDSHASLTRRLGNTLYNKLATIMTGHRIDDLTSGFRVARANKFRKFLYLLPNGFSYPTTITMAFFRSGYAVGYVPIAAKQREGKSHISLLKDGMKFFVIILKIGSLFSPMRLFLPVSLTLFSLGLINYGYTYIATGRFTNMSALLFVSSVVTFLIGIVSEQISALHYKGIDNDTVSNPIDD